MADAEVHSSLRTDQRVTLSGASWADYERLLAIRGENAIPRITYQDGEIEFVSPSQLHEIVAKMIARLVEAYAEERDISLYGVGSWTIKKRRRQTGLEPDECYVLGHEKKPRPDLAIEVVVGRGGLRKLDLYQKLGVPEVWIWRGGSLRPYVLRGDRYEAAERSALLPGLDLDLVAKLAERLDQTEVVRAFRRALREQRPPA